MDASTPHRTREQFGILRWLRFGSAGQVETAATAEQQAEPLPEGSDNPREQQRHKLLYDINDFIQTHRLDVNPYTLAIAHDVITGTDPRLAHLIETRIATFQPVTMEWLEETGRNDGSELLNALMAKFESSLEEFSQTTKTARTATNDFNSALETHVGELEQVSKAGMVISELAAIAKVMLQRTREIEQKMSRSEMQTRALQSNLEEARRKAELDHLTGLPNRRAFENALEQEIAAARAAEEPLCVAFCDIDHFKRINDGHGHEAGDRVLKEVAQTLAQIADDHCHVSRHGGEEFAILFRGRTVDEACQKLDAMREAMAERRLVNRETQVPFGSITFSAGIADIFAYGNYRAALRAADDALYAAKNNGRNKVLKADQLNLQAVA